MAYSALTGALGVAVQTAKGTPNTADLVVLPALSVNVNMQQDVTQTPPEIGGSLFLRNSYKKSVGVKGDASFNVRPHSFGVLLKAFSGVYATGAGPEGGMTKHTFNPAALGTDIPWLTIVKGIFADAVNGNFQEQYTDCRVAGLRITVPSQGLVTCAATFQGITPVGADSLTIPASDISGCLVTSANPGLLPGGNGTLVDLITIGGVNAKLVTATFDFQNTLSNDEFSIGSPFADGITLLQRTANVTLDVVIRDSVLYRKIVQAGGAVNWSPSIYRDSLVVKTIQANNAPSHTNPESLTITTGYLDFTMMPIALQGDQLIRAQITAAVTINDPSTEQGFQFDLVNTQTASY